MITDKKAINKKPKSIVIQKNDLIQGNYKSLNTVDIKLFKYLISKVNDTNNLFEDYLFFTTKELKKELNINDKNIHQIIMNSLYTLSNTYLAIPIKNSEEIIQVGLIQNKYKIYRSYGRYSIKLHEDIRDYVQFNKKLGKFTQYNLLNIKHLNKKEIKLYEYLQMIDLKDFEIMIEKIIEIMELGQSYKIFNNFKKVFEKAVLKINEYTQTEIVNYAYLKSAGSRKYNKVALTVNKQSDKERTERLKLLRDLQSLEGKNIIINDKEHQIISMLWNDRERRVEARVKDTLLNIYGNIKYNGSLQECYNHFKNNTI